MRPHRRQPTRLPRPWDSPGKNTGVGCPFLLQCMKVKSESEVAQSCPTLSDPMDCSPPGPPSMGFSRQEYWSGVPLPSPSPILVSHFQCVGVLLVVFIVFTSLYMLKQLPAGTLLTLASAASSTESPAHPMYHVCVTATQHSSAS